MVTFAGGGDGSGATAENCGANTGDCYSTANNCYDGVKTDAKFKQPKGITSDGVNLYVADNGNCRIRKILISTGAVSTMAGDGGSHNGISSDGTGINAAVVFPQRITTDGKYLYFTEYVIGTSNKVRKIDTSSVEVTTLAGNTSGYVDGTSDVARFQYPSGIVTDGNKLFITNNHSIRQME